MKLGNLFWLGALVLSGLAQAAPTYQFRQYVAGVAPASCSAPWDSHVTVQPGATVTAYASATVGFGQSCQSEVRTCSAGVLSGTYAFAGCTAGAGPTTWDPAGPSGTAYLAAGNLRIQENSSALAPIRSVASHTTGKWYWEIHIEGLSSQGDVWLGVLPSTAPHNSVWNNIGGAHWRSEGQYEINNNNSGGRPGYEYASNRTLMFALDADTGKVWFGSDCYWNTGNPATGAAPTAVMNGAGSAAWKVSYVTEQRTGNNVLTANFGGSAFACAVPAGFNAGF